MNERIELSASAGLSVYAVVRNEFGQPWNTTSSSFEDYADDHLPQYAVPLAEEGDSGFYSAGFPSAIPAGTYTVVAYARAGEAPAPTDVALGQGEIHRTTTVTISGGLLVTPDYVKNALQVTDDSLDGYLTQAIADVSDAVTSYLGGRQLAAADHVETVGEGQGDVSAFGRVLLRVAHPPVNAVYSVQADVDTPAPITLATSQYTYDATTGVVRLRPGSVYGSSFGWCGSGGISVSYNGGYNVIPGGVQRAVAIVIGRLLRSYSSVSPHVQVKRAGDVSVQYFDTSGVDLGDPVFGDAARLLAPYKSSTRY